MAKPITIEILGDNKSATKAISGVGTALGSLSKVALGVGAALAVGVFAAGGALFSLGSKFNEMKNIIIEGTGATGDALEGFNDSALEVLKQVPEAGDVVAGVLADVNTFFGLTGAELESTTELMLDFARVTGVDANTAVGNLDAALTQFGVPVENANEVLGDFLRISQATGVPMDKLLSQMETFGPVFSNAGFTLEETTAILGGLERAGVDLTRVGPALAKFFSNMAAQGKDPREELERITTEMANATSETDALNIATEAFGRKGAQELTTAVRTGNFALDDFNGLLGEGTGLVADQAAATATFTDKWNEFKNKILVVLEPLATRVFEAMSGGMDKLNERMPEIEKGFNEKILPAARQALGWLRDNGIPILVAIKDGFITVWETLNEDVLPVLDSLWEKGKNAFDTISELAGELKDDFQTMWQTVGPIFNEIVDDILVKAEELLGKVKLAWAQLNETMSGLGIDVGPKVLKILKAMGITIGILVGLILGAIVVVLTIGGAFVTAFTKALEWVDKAKKWIADIRENFINDKNSLIESIKAPFRSAIDWVKEQWDKLKKKLETAISIPNPLSGITDFIPGFGNAMGTSSLGASGMLTVGERGPEQVFLPRGSRVVPNHRRGSGGGDTFNIHTNADASAIATEVAWKRRFGNGR